MRLKFLLKTLTAVAVLAICASSANAQQTSPQWTAFVRRNGGNWFAVFDNAGRFQNATGSGIPWIGGRGNKLPRENGNVLAVVEARARAFVNAERDLLRSTGYDFQLDANRSQVFGPHAYLIKVVFNAVSKGVVVRDATLTFFVNNGNMVAFGTELPDAPPTLSVLPLLSTEAVVTAARILVPSELLGDEAKAGPPEWRKTNGRDSVVRRVTIGGGSSGMTFDVDAQTGAAIRIERPPMIDGAPGSGASSNGVAASLSGVATGGVKLRLFSDPDMLMPLGHLAVNGSSGSSVTDPIGQFSVSGTSASGQLNGPYATITDRCGSSLVTTTSSRLDFGNGTSTDCSGDVAGAPGATRASRTTFFHINHIRDVYKALDSTTNWLDTPALAVTNYQVACHNEWDGTSIILNGQLGSPACSNAGENPGIVYHEWGHAYQQHVFSPPTDGASAEGYADVTALLQTHISCIAAGFFLNQMSPEGGSTCDGYRQLDYKLLSPSVAAKPSNITAAPYNCPVGAPGGYNGILGYEAHCESHIETEAMWEFASAMRAKYGDSTAWQKIQRLWVTGSKSFSGAWEIRASDPGSDGCGLANWFEELRIADDDDGDLSNGTPNSFQLYSAFANHDIACAPQAPWNIDFATCPSLAKPAPTLFYNFSAGGYELHWAPVTNAISYEVFRSDIGPQGPYQLLGEATVAGYVDTGRPNDLPVWYAVAALDDGNCTSPLSDPVTVACATRLAGVRPLQAATMAASQPVTISWTSSMTATHYSLYLGTTTSPGYYGSYSGTQATVSSLANGTTYYWKVIAFNDNPNCPQTVSDLRSFTIAPTCSGPESLVSPADGTLISSAGTANLSWSAALSATKFSLYLGHTSNPGYYGTYTSTQTTLTGLTAGTTYYWKIVAYNDNVYCPASVSEVRSFVVAPTCTGAESLVSPADGTLIGSAGTTTLSWSAAISATKYSLYLGTTSSPGYYGTYTSTQTTLSGLAPGATYYWKVVAYNDNANCPPAITEVRSFSVAPVCAGPESLVSPADGSIISSAGTVTLSWSAAISATKFSLYLGKTSSPGYYGTYTSTQTTLSGLTAGATYYWKIVAYNDNVYCPASVSEIRSFLVAPVCAGPESLVSPADGAGVASGSPVNLTWSAALSATKFSLYLGKTSSPGYYGSYTTTSASVSGLTPGATYYWKIVAYNDNISCPQSVSEVRSFVVSP